MADTFDKVKSTEEAHLLLARAHFIDASEAELTDFELKEIKWVLAPLNLGRHSKLFVSF